MDLPTYTNIWRIEKRLYKLYDFRLPAPLPITWIAVFAGITVPYVVFLVAVGLPFNHNLVWLYVLPPGVLTWLTTRPVIESKRLPELIGSQLRYLTEPRVWSRMAPSAEKDDILVSVRVWHRYPPKVKVRRAARATKRVQQKERHVAPPHVRPPTAVNRPEEGWRVAAQRPAPQRVVATSGARHAVAPSAPPMRPPGLLGPAPRQPVPQRQPAAPPNQFQPPAQFAPGPQPTVPQVDDRSWFERATPVPPVPPGPRPIPANAVNFAPPQPPRPPARPAQAAPEPPEPPEQPERAGAAEEISTTTEEAATVETSKPVEVPKPLTVPVAAAREPRPAPHPAATAEQPVIGGWKPRPAPLMPSAPAAETTPKPAPLPPAAPEPETQPESEAAPPLASPLELSHDVADHWFAPGADLPEATTSTSPDPPVRPSDPPIAPQPAQPVRPAARIVDLDEERPVPSIERALSAPNARRDLSWRRRVRVVAGGQGPGKRDQESLDRERARLPLSTHKNIVVLGCHGGAGQTTTAVMTARLLATLRGQPVAALDLSDDRKPGTRTSGGNLDIIAAEGTPDYDDLAQHYPLLVIDPAPSGLTRVLDVTDQLVIVAPPDPEAATHLASTQQWLEAHDHADLAARAVTVINGVTRESMADVVRAESVARGRCRAIVRVPWDDLLSTKHPQVPRTPQTRLAYTALSGVIIAGLAAAPLAAGVRGDGSPRSAAGVRGTVPPGQRRPGEHKGKGPPQHPVLRRPDPADRHARVGVLPRPRRVVRVHHARGTRSAGHEHHGRARRDPDAGRRSPPPHRAPLLPGARVGDRPRRHVGRRPRLAPVPGAVLPARLVEGLLGQGDLHRRPPWPARHARAALRRRADPVHLALQDHRAEARAGRRGCQCRRNSKMDRHSGTTRARSLG